MKNESSDVTICTSAGLPLAAHTKASAIGSMRPRGQASRSRRHSEEDNEEVQTAETRKEAPSSLARSTVLARGIPSRHSDVASFCPAVYVMEGRCTYKCSNIGCASLKMS